MKHTRIIVFADTAWAIGREVVEGVGQYVQAHTGIHVLLAQPHTWTERIPEYKEWDGAIVTHGWPDEKLPKLIDQPRPIVSAVYPRLHTDWPTVNIHDYQVGALAADHLMACGFWNFASGCVHHPNYQFAEDRHQGFERQLREAGHTCNRYSGPPHSEYYFDEIEEWLLSLPKPCAIFMMTDVTAYMAMELANKHDIRVPDDWAIVGVNNDVMCNLWRPALSSIQLPCHQVGFHAAEMLCQLIEEKPVDNRHQLVEPTHVIRRASSDVIAVKDAEVAKALKHIRETACYGLTVNELVDMVDISRSSLEHRFRELLGRTPLQEITRVRILRTKHLLSDPIQPMADIAKACGFSSPNQLAIVFKRETGETPSQYRTRTT